MKLRWPGRRTAAAGERRRLGRQAFDLLALTMAMVLVVHAGHLPGWLSGSLAVLLAARWYQRRYRGGRVPLWLRLPLTLGLPVAVIAQYGTLFGQEPGSALVTGMLVLKLLEAEHSRDARTGVAFACFGLMSALLFGQGMLATQIVGLGLIPAIATLNALEPARPPWRWRNAPGPVLRMLALALPLALLGFFFIPRLSAPLWGAPGDATARTGISASMSPGDIGQLLIDDSPAFRVSFDGHRPPRVERYFRGPVLWHFDGRTWTRGHTSAQHRARSRSSRIEPLTPMGGFHDYQITLQPTRRHWMFALDMPVSPPADGHFTPARTLLHGKRIDTILSYRMRSSTRYVLEPTLDATTRERALQLPAGFDPRARVLAEQWQRQFHGDPKSIVDAALRLFHQGGFGYTLAPPPLGRNSVDDFLFSTREGFCEHYASAFTFLMRAAGVPARVVTGYQGGYWNTMGAYLLIRQSDAHAWSEVWVKGRGWIRVDPTAAVQPARVDIGAMAAAGASREWYQAAWLQNLRNRWDIVNRWWNQAVTGFDALRQRGLLKPFGIRHAGARQLGLAFAIGLSLLLVIAASLALWRRPHVDPARRAMQRLERRLARLGIVRERSEGPRNYLMRAADELQHERAALLALLDAYLHLRYASEGEETESVRNFVRQVREFRPRRAVQ